jgi:hypothetical protein
MYFKTLTMNKETGHHAFIFGRVVIFFTSFNVLDIGWGSNKGGAESSIEFVFVREGGSL